MWWKILNYSKKQSPSSEINSVFASQEIHLIIWENKVRNRIQNSRPLVPILSQTNPVHALTNLTGKSNALSSK